MASRILLLEDNDQLAELEHDALQKEGHMVTRVRGGVDALTTAATRGGFNMALLDIDVDGLSGLGVARVLADLADMPVVVLSGRRTGWRRQALEAGAVACLAKPFDVNALFSLVKAVEASEKKTPRWVGDVRQLSTDDLSRIGQLSKDELDALPFGAIQLDREARIVAYNAFESWSSGHAANEVIGKRFYDLAPCVLVKEFVSTVDAGLSARKLDEVLRFIFPFHGAACLVSVRLYVEDGDERLWLFVSLRRGGLEGNGFGQPVNID